MVGSDTHHNNSNRVDNDTNPTNGNGNQKKKKKGNVMEETYEKLVEHLPQYIDEESQQQMRDFQESTLR